MSGRNRMHSDSVDILLATYNGAKYIEEQIFSLMLQRGARFRIFARDDASTDTTPRVLGALAGRFPDYFGGIQLMSQRQGPVRGYAALLENATADYIMFCDQDDIWLREKIRVSLNTMKRAEAACGSRTPILLHTDMMVVNAELTPVYSSFMASHHLNPRHSTLNRLLVQNIITGCTVMINRALREKVGAIPDDARMHDWWMGLVAAMFGHVLFVQAPTVLYRQHGANFIGARPLNLATARERVRQFPDMRRDWKNNISQARALVREFDKDMRSAHKRICNAFIELSAMPPLKRWETVCRHRFFKHGLLRNAGLPFLF